MQKLRKPTYNERDIDELSDKKARWARIALSKYSGRLSQSTDTHRFNLNPYTYIHHFIKTDKAIEEKTISRQEYSRSVDISNKT